MSSFKVSIHSIIKKDSKILLTKRPATAKFGPNHWDTPGGSLELGEDPIDGLCREVREETSLVIQVKRPLAVFSKVIPENQNQIICLVFLCEYVSGKVSLSKEHVEYRWVSREEAARLPLVDYLEKALNDLDENC